MSHLRHVCLLYQTMIFKALDMSQCVEAFDMLCLAWCVLSAVTSVWHH